MMPQPSRAASAFAVLVLSIFSRQLAPLRSGLGEHDASERSSQSNHGKMQDASEMDIALAQLLLLRRQQGSSASFIGISSKPNECPGPFICTECSSIDATTAMSKIASYQSTFTSIKA